MTTELEKQFFDTFGIEPKKIYLCSLCKTKLSGCTWVGDKQRFECLYSWGEHPYYMGKEVEEKAIIDYEYPQITDKHYLELIVLLSGVCCMNFAFERRLNEMKYKILKITMEFGKILKHQVQQLFKE